MNSSQFAPLGDIVQSAQRDGLVDRISVSVIATDPDGVSTSWDSGGNDVFLSASTIKVAILAAVARAIDAGTLRHNDRRSATDDDTMEGSGVLAWMEPDLFLSIDDHAYLMIAISDNTASNVLIRAAGLARIQETIDDLGLPRTHLRRPFMGRIPTDDLPRNEITTNGLTMLFEAIMADRAASPEACVWMRRLLNLQQHLDRLGRNLPAGVTYYGKTGTIENHVHDAAVIEGPGGRVAVAALTETSMSKYTVDPVLGQIGRRAADLAGVARRR